MLGRSLPNFNMFQFLFIIPHQYCYWQVSARLTLRIRVLKDVSSEQVSLASSVCLAKRYARPNSFTQSKMQV